MLRQRREKRGEKEAGADLCTRTKKINYRFVYIIGLID
jgi:hypothetical protein